ncbi:MAG: hypothetical protein HY812_07095 [Planctomycetes bacterium]|nr:hypothetical protein [Planctomycetota bacterium]
MTGDRGPGRIIFAGPHGVRARRIGGEADVMVCEIEEDGDVGEWIGDLGGAVDVIEDLDLADLDIEGLEGIDELIERDLAVALEPGIEFQCAGGSDCGGCEDEAEEVTEEEEDEAGEEEILDLIRDLRAEVQDLRAEVRRLKDQVRKSGVRLF